MSDRHGSYPPDEPIIGGSYPSSGAYAPAQDEPIGDPSAAYNDGDDEAEWDDEYDEYDDDDGYYDDYDDGGTPARQPMFYVFIGLAALIGGIVIFLLFSLVNNGGGGATPPATEFKVFVDSPTPNQRIETGQATDVNVRAKSSEAITKFELFADDQSVDLVAVTNPPAADGTYSATLKLPAYDNKGTYHIKIRVTAASGAHKDSDPVTIIAIEPVGAKPQSVKGKVVADATAREGPGDDFPVAKTLTAGTDVNIVGRTSDSQWLLVDIDGGRWVKRNAITAQDSLDLVPVRNPTPVAQPTPTIGVRPSPSPTAAPTVNAKDPDFFPAGASLSDDGKTLHVVVGNQATNGYIGPLVVSVSGVSPGTLTMVFNVNVPANGSATVDFDVDISSGADKTANVKVDSGNAIHEQNEDNNNASFPVKIVAENPQLSLSVAVEDGGTLAVTVKNSGGALAAPSATIRVTLGSASSSIDKPLAIAKGASQTVNGVQKPQGSGTATVDVIVNGTKLASATVAIS
jgi:uncharacterized protein YraI